MIARWLYNLEVKIILPLSYTVWSTLFCLILIDYNFAECCRKYSLNYKAEG